MYPARTDIVIRAILKNNQNLAGQCQLLGLSTVTVVATKAIHTSNCSCGSLQFASDWFKPNNNLLSL